MMQKDAREENVIATKQQLSIEVQVEVQQDTKVQVMVEVQQRVMEMEEQESKVVDRRRRIILDKATLLEKGIKILDLE